VCCVTESSYSLWLLISTVHYVLTSIAFSAYRAICKTTKIYLLCTPTVFVLIRFRSRCSDRKNSSWRVAWHAPDVCAGIPFRISSYNVRNQGRFCVPTHCTSYGRDNPIRRMLRSRVSFSRCHILFLSVRYIWLVFFGC